MSRINRLDVENFKRISVVEIEPGPGGLAVVAGRNAQGKSSVLDGIEALLRGGRAFPDKPVRTGEARAVLRCELDDGIVIERTIAGNGNASLKITTADGMSPRNPQAWLDGKLAAGTCDPLAFLRAKPADQAAELRRIVGVDTTSLDQERARVYAERTEHGRRAKEYAGTLATLPVPPEGTPLAPVSASAVAEELEAARVVESERDQILTDAEERATEAKRLRGASESERLSGQNVAADLRIQAKALREQADEMDRDADEAEKHGAELATQRLAEAEQEEALAADLRAKAAGMTVPDQEEIRARLAAVDRVNAAVAQAQRRAEAEAERAKWAARVDEATARIETLDAQRLALLDGARWPVEGLGIEDGTVTFRGVPLSQASQAEQLRVGVALALAGKPEIRVALVRDGSHLDDDGMVLLSQIADEHGAQVWVERVGTGDAGAIVIEDGTVKADDAPAIDASIDTNDPRM